jgi:hypothetical protein
LDDQTSLGQQTSGQLFNSVKDEERAVVMQNSNG